MLANANWERPIYMSMTVGTDNYPAVLQDFFVHEGLAYRITPFNWKKLGYSDNDAPVDTDLFYENIMNRFKWGAVKENKDYYADETVRRMIYTHRNLLANLAQTMFYKKEADEKVMDVLEKWYDVFPNDIVAYDALRDNSITIANIYKLLYLKQHYGKDNGLKPELSEEKTEILEKRIYEIAGAIVKEQYEYLRWYNTLGARGRSDMMIYARASMLREAWMILGNAPVGDIGSDEIADVVAKNIYKECDILQNSDASGLENTKFVDTKIQLISNLYTFLGEMAKSEALDNKIAATIEQIAKLSEKRLKRYNVARLSEAQKQEILSVLRLIATAGEMSNKLGEKNENTKILVNSIYSNNVEKFASHVID